MSPSFVFLLLSLTFAADHNKVEAQPPGVIKLGNWTYQAHGCKGGQVTILDKNRIQIENFHYDGKGPEAWFQIGLVKLGKDDVPHPCSNHRRHPIIPDPKQGCSKKPESYKNTNLILTIPSKYQWEDIDYVALYCYRFQHLFGFVKIPYFSTSGLPAETTKVNSCSGQNQRIIKEYTRGVKCRDLSKPWATNVGSFP